MKAYGWGHNTYGQLGLGHNATFVSTITELTTWGVSVDKVSAGSFHSMFIDQSGFLHGCGGNAHGQIGYGTTDNIQYNIKSPIYQGESPIKISEISCGQYNTYLRRDNGVVYRAGNNNYNQCGYNNAGLPLKSFEYQSYSLIMTDLKSFGGGEFYSVFLRNDNQAYVFGYSSAGQLGLNATTTTGLLTSIYGANINRLDCGFSHILILRNDGTVSAIGNNNNGQLGINSVKSAYMTPQDITTMSNIKDVSAGTNTSLFLLENGDLYGCGLARLLGLGYAETDTTKLLYPQKLNAPKKISKIKTNTASTVVLTADGELYMAGNTGLTALGFSSTFVKIPLSFKVLDFTTGSGNFGYTIILTDEEPLDTKKKNNQAIWF